MSTSLTGRRRSYVAVQVTLTLADTPYRLLDLVNIVLAAETGMATPPMVCPDACSQLCIQGDAANHATNLLLIGDALVSTTRFGYSLLKTEKRVYEAPRNAVQFGSLYAFSHQAGQILTVEVMTS